MTNKTRTIFITHTALFICSPPQRSGRQRTPTTVSQQFTQTALQKHSSRGVSKRELPLLYHNHRTTPSQNFLESDETVIKKTNSQQNSGVELT